MPRETAVRQPLCADVDGCSLHAAVRVEANDRKRLEELCRYTTWPALSDVSVQLNAAERVELKLKTPWRDGTTHLEMIPLEIMQRLATLLPRPRLRLIGSLADWIAACRQRRLLAGTSQSGVQVGRRKPVIQGGPVRKILSGSPGSGYGRQRQFVAFGCSRSARILRRPMVATRERPLSPMLAFSAA